MDANTIEISVKGRPVLVPSVKVNGQIIYAAGGWLKVASVKDEAWLDRQPVEDLEGTLDQIRNAGLQADIFTFAQRLSDPGTRYDYPHELDNLAAIPISTYAEWWEKRLPQETRKNVRRSAKRGVEVRQVEFNDDLVRAIVEINNESPIRQGRPYWHYGKSFEVVKKDYATLLDRSTFIGAFLGQELIGFIKLVDMGEIAGILQIVCMNKHQDKRPPSALIAKAVEIASERKQRFLTYGKYVYGNNTMSPLTEFKRRNGFEQMFFPRYYIPLSLKGRIAVALGLHLSFKRFLPGKLHFFLLTQLSRWNTRASSKSAATEVKAEEGSD